MMTVKRSQQVTKVYSEQTVRPGDKYRSELATEIARKEKALKEEGRHTEQPLYEAYLELAIKVEERSAGSYKKGQ
jgi:hypothetical protein